MENEQLNIIIEHLEKQDGNFVKLLENKSLVEAENLIKAYLEVSKKQYKTFITTLVVEEQKLKNELEKTNENLLQLNKKLPATINKTYHFDRNSRNELLLGAIGVIFFIVFGMISINHFRDNTDYKKDWGELMDKKMTTDQRLYLNSILKETND